MYQTEFPYKESWGHSEVQVEPALYLCHTLTSYRFPGESMHIFLAEELSDCFLSHEVESSHSEETVSGLGFQILVSVNSFWWFVTNFFIELWLENIVCTTVLGNVSYRSIFLCLGTAALYSPCFTLLLMLLGPGFRQWSQTPPLVLTSFLIL